MNTFASNDFSDAVILTRNEISKGFFNGQVPLTTLVNPSASILYKVMPSLSHTPMSWDLNTMI